MQILLILISSGSLGFVSYLIMRELSILNLPLREKEIEKITLIHFSIFNTMAVYAFYWIVFDVDLLDIDLDTSIFIRIIILSILTSIFMPIFYSIVLFIARKLFSGIQDKKNLITTKYKPLFDELLLPHKYKDTYIVMFDFSNEFIHAGHLDRMEYKEGKLYFSLHAAPYNDIYDYEEIIKKFHKEGQNEDKFKIIIDTDREMKYFIMYDPFDD